MQNIGTILVFLGLFTFIFTSSGLIQERFLGKEINRRKEKQKVKRILPVSASLIAIGAAINIFLIV